ncbi:Uncharacterised protein [Vibrio cholerae]|nr:Uncharacterised protein [Vibrio cholerae]
MSSKRCRFSRTRLRRVSSQSIATTWLSGVRSKMCAVLPPGAAQQSKISSPACGAR